MLKKINDKGIFDFSHMQFDGVRVQTDDSGMEEKKIRTVTLKTAKLFQRHTEHYVFF